VSRPEAELCDQIAVVLRGQGWRVECEYMTKHGRVDIAVLHPSKPSPIEFIEAKLRHPLAGIGQLLAYGIAAPAPRPMLTLVVPAALHQPGLAEVCAATGIRLWAYQSLERQQVSAAFYSPERVAARQQQRDTALTAQEVMLAARKKGDREWERMIRAVRQAQERARARLGESSRVSADN
jgi:hypothetical protein